MARLVDVRAVVGVHLEHAADTLLLVLDAVEHRVALGEGGGEGEGEGWGWGEGWGEGKVGVGVRAGARVRLGRG